MTNLQECRHLLNEDVLTKIGEYVPNMNNMTYVVNPVLKHIEREPRMRTCFVSPMEEATVQFLPYGECLRVAYPVVEHRNHLWYVELHIFKSVEARSFYMQYVATTRRCLLQEIRRSIFRTKVCKHTQRRYYVLLQKFVRYM